MDGIEITNVDASQVPITTYVTTNPAATFYARVKGANAEENIKDGDLLVIDKSLDPQEGDLVVMITQGQLVLKRIKNGNQQIAWYMTGDDRSRIWGKVAYIIKMQR